jgi:hypothetical protein
VTQQPQKSGGAARPAETVGWQHERRRRAPLTALLLATASITGTLRGGATETAEPPARPGGVEATPAPQRLDPRRFEVAGFPIVGGNSDIGVQLGGAATFTRFHDDVQPYLWNIDVLLSVSFKGEDGHAALIQQNHLLRLDAPSLLDGRLRIDSKLIFQRTINEGYYGVGNATVATLPAGQADPAHRYQYVEEEGGSRTIARVHTGTPIDIALGALLRYSAPTAYAGSKLEQDTAVTPSGGRTVRGIEHALLGTVSAGLMYDTRDSEFVTSRGLFYQLGLAGTVGSAESVAYGEASAVLAHYTPISGPFIFAARAVASFKSGVVPFYDLAQGGVFEPQYLFGSDSGVRGVPNGRYSGLIKTLANLEVRSTLPRFVFLQQRIRFGTTTFVDAGRAWSDYTFDRAADGTGVGLKYGVGGGAFIQWGEAAIFRVEAAYSPDAAAENPGFPIGFYVADGLMF